MKWLLHSNHPERLSDMGCGHYKGDLFTFGGMNNTEQNPAVTRIYQFLQYTKQWTLLSATLPKGFNTHSYRTNIDSVIWVRDATNKIFEFDYTTKKLTENIQIAVPPSPSKLTYVEDYEQNVIALHNKSVIMKLVNSRVKRETKKKEINDEKEYKGKTKEKQN